MKWAPPYDYAADVWLPLLDRIGVNARLELRASGWFPLGKGEILARIDGRGRAVIGGLPPIDAAERGRLLRVRGRAIAANLPSHVSERMAARARWRLQQVGAPVEIAAITTGAACPGAGLFLVAEYENCGCGFGALGERGKPSELVADEAVDRLLAHGQSGAAFDRHLADQALLPLALAWGTSRFTTEAVTPHLESNGWVIEQFGLARVHWRRDESGVGTVQVEPLRGGDATD
jgi:RNA 3'-terminal phosphate cyclase (ATP)